MNKGKTFDLQLAAVMGTKSFHIAMFPLFAFGHMTPFLHAANKLADRGHQISFILPIKAQAKLQSFNLHPNLITFVPITVPHVDGLPAGAETTADVPFSLQHLIAAALDLTQPVIEAFLKKTKPHFILFDFAHWVPKIGRELGIKSVLYCIISSVTIGYFLSPERKLLEKPLEAVDALQPPPNFPPSKIKLQSHEARGLTAITTDVYGKEITFQQRQLISFTECDAIGFKTCREMEGPYCDYIAQQFGKQVLLAGPTLPEIPNSVLDEKWENWFGKFEENSVIFCAFGSECILTENQFQELLLGFELTGYPFFVALKPPFGAESLESAFPEGFEERVKGRGVVYGGWVQQQLILKHPAVGCFVTHCGSGSLSEGLVNECQMVLVPHKGDQFINARLMSRDLKVGVEVEKGDEDGLFSKEGVCEAVKCVMDDDSVIGKEVRKNHEKWRKFLLSDGLENSYMDGFVQKLEGLLE